MTLASLLPLIKHGTLTLRAEAFDELVTAGAKVTRTDTDKPEVYEHAELFIGSVYVNCGRMRTLTRAEIRARLERLEREMEEVVDVYRETEIKDREIDAA